MVDVGVAGLEVLGFFGGAIELLGPLALCSGGRWKVGMVAVGRPSAKSGTDRLWRLRRGRTESAERTLRRKTLA